MVSVNFNKNIIRTSPEKKSDISKSYNNEDGFKTYLDKQQLVSKKDSYEDTKEKLAKCEELVKSQQQEKPCTEVSEGKGKFYNDLKKYLNENELSLETDKGINTEIIKLLKTSLEDIEEMSKDTMGKTDNKDLNEDELTQIQQLLMFLNSMVQAVSTENKASEGQSNINIAENMVSTLELQETNKGQSDINIAGNMFSTFATEKVDEEQNDINIQQLIDLAPISSDTKAVLKNNLNDILSLLEKTKGNSEFSSQITDMLQKLSVQVEEVKKDFNLLKVPYLENNKDVIEDKSQQKILTSSMDLLANKIEKTSLGSSNYSSGGNKSSDNKSSEDKFLNNLLVEDKDEVKISKAVNFMNQFEKVDNLASSKVETQTPVISKDSFQVDFIKAIKFMENNNVKDLTVKIMPKELGEITIKLTMEVGIMKAQISAQNKDTYNLINHNIQDITQNLKNMDIKIQSFDLGIYEDSTFFSKDSKGGNNQGTQHNNSKSNLGEEEEISINNNYVIEENQVNKFV